METVRILKLLIGLAVAFAIIACPTAKAAGKGAGAVAPALASHSAMPTRLLSCESGQTQKRLEVMLEGRAERRFNLMHGASQQAITRAILRSLEGENSKEEESKY